MGRESVVVGCGKNGLDLAIELLDRNNVVQFFVDNKDDVNGLSAYDILIRKLISLGIEENEIQRKDV